MFNKCKASLPSCYTGSTVEFFKISFCRINFMLVINLPAVLQTSWHHVHVYSGRATNKKLQ